MSYYGGKYYDAYYYNSRYYGPTPDDEVTEDLPLGGPSDGMQRLLHDDEVIIMVARAFLTMVH